VEHLGVKDGKVLYKEEALKEALPSNAFGGRGKDSGPQTRLTDNCIAELNAYLAKHRTILLHISCVVELRWLCDSNHKIHKLQ